jgi:GNAT superfamily N-acetyltransferase
MSRLSKVSVNQKLTNVSQFMKTYTVRPLDNSASELSAAVDILSTNCPSESERYEKTRLVAEVSQVDTGPFYRKFFGAFDLDGALIGIGGIKAADWASDTHILYLMAVEIEHRGMGVGSDLEMIRIQWLRENFLRGRCLVSTRHKKRFERWGFKSLSEVDSRHLMMLEF